MRRRSLRGLIWAVAPLWGLGCGRADTERDLQHRALLEVIDETRVALGQDPEVLCVSLSPLPTDPPAALVERLEETGVRAVRISECLYGPDETAVVWDSRPAVAIWIGQPDETSAGVEIVGGYYENPTSSARFVCSSAGRAEPVRCRVTSVS